MQDPSTDNAEADPEPAPAKGKTPMFAGRLRIGQGRDNGLRLRLYDDEGDKVADVVVELQEGLTWPTFRTATPQNGAGAGAVAQAPARVPTPQEAMITPGCNCCMRGRYPELCKACVAADAMCVTCGHNLSGHRPLPHFSQAATVNVGEHRTCPTTGGVGGGGHMSDVR